MAIARRLTCHRAPVLWCNSMSPLEQLLQTLSLAACPQGAADALAAKLGQPLGLAVYPESIVASSGVVYAMGRRGREKRLVVAAKTEPQGWTGELLALKLDGVPLHVVHASLTPSHAARVRERLPFTAAQPLGVQRSLGCGDRLGLATPGHVRAVRGTNVAPIFAQQSIREMDRSQRSPQQVMDSATWGVLQEGWTEPWGSDADHLKTTDAIDACAAAGFTMYTFDPGDHVNDAADALPNAEVAAQFDALPWAALETTAAETLDRYTKQPVRIGDDLVIEFSDESLRRAAVKYGPAVAHAALLYRHLASVMGERPYEAEVSVDETATPTRVEEHYYIANELRRLGVQWVSLAPRFVGDFEKGVDYQGDLAEFERTYAQHVAIARELGPYKISLHSGSDKFSVYPIAAKLSGDLVHVKTAGTSYLEALRTIATVEPGLMREILAFAIERYEHDRASYHVSAELAKVPAPGDLTDDALPGLLDQFDARQVLHVTYGSVLSSGDPPDGARSSSPLPGGTTGGAAEGGRTASAKATPPSVPPLEGGDCGFRIASPLKPRLLAALEGHEDEHYATLERHLRRHAEPFSKAERRKT